MTRLKSYLLFILLISLMNNCFCIRKTELLNILKKFDSRIKVASEKFQIFSNFFHSDASDESQESNRTIDKTDEILSEMQGLQALSFQSHQMPLYLNQSFDIIKKKLPVSIQVNLNFINTYKFLTKQIKHIDDLYDTYSRRVLEEPDDARTQHELIRKTLNVSAAINGISRAIISDPTFDFADAFLITLVNKLKTINDSKCDQTQTVHMWLYEIYVKILTTEVKGYVLNMIAYSIKSELSKDSYTHTMNGLTKDLSRRVGEYAAEFRTELARLPRDMRRCDPKNHIRGETFTEFMIGYQPFLVNEDQFGPDHVCDSCKIRLEFGSALTQKSGLDYVGGTCNGLVTDCMTCGYLTGSKSTVCVLPRGSNKRYQWMKNPITHRDYTNHCSGQIKEIKSHWGQGRSESRICPYCLCQCSEQSSFPVIEAINLLPTLTDINENMVLVGLRIVEEGRVLRIRVKQGKMLPGGQIDPNFVSWKTSIDLESQQSQNVTGGQSKRLLQLSDYLPISKSRLSFALDEMIAEKNSIICGVRFEFQTSNRVINVRIGTASFNWATGQVDNNCQWVSLNSSKLGQIASMPFLPYDLMQKMLSSEDPIKAPYNNVFLKNKFIYFVKTDMNPDLGQSIVPFFDSLPVETPALPVGGISFYHKSAPDFGGFISPKIYNLNMADYLSS